MLQVSSFALFTFSLCLIVTSCKDASKPNSSSDNQQAVQSPTEETVVNDQGLIVDQPKDVAPSGLSENEGFLTYTNSRYSFAIDAPKTWSVIDKSGNGDGFFISIPEEDQVEIRIYGEKHDELLAEFYDSSCEDKQDFEFSSGFTGVRCVSPEEMTYSVIHQENRISAYIKYWDKAKISNRVNLTTMIKSLRFLQKDSNEPS